MVRTFHEDVISFLRRKKYFAKILYSWRLTCFLYMQIHQNNKFPCRIFANVFRLGQFRKAEVEHAIQMDSSSCGVLVCLFADAHLKHKSMCFEVDSQAIIKHRKRIWRCLVRGSQCPESLCAGCGEVDLPTAVGTGRKNDWVSLLDKLRVYSIIFTRKFTILHSTSMRRLNLPYSLRRQNVE